MMQWVSNYSLQSCCQQGSTASMLRFCCADQFNSVALTTPYGMHLIH